MHCYIVIVVVNIHVTITTTIITTLTNSIVIMHSFIAGVTQKLVLFSNCLPRLFKKAGTSEAMGS